MKTRIVLAIVMLAAVLISGCVRSEFEIELDGQGNELKRTVRFLTQEQQVAAMYLQGIRQDVLESYGEEEMQFVEFTEFDGPEWYGAELVFLVAEAKDSGIDLSEESLVVTDKDDRLQSLSTSMRVPAILTLPRKSGTTTRSLSLRSPLRNSQESTA